MGVDFIAFAGRPWPVDEDCPTSRWVGHFHSLAEAHRAYSAVTFVRLPSREGRLRWRGWAADGMIIQIERPLREEHRLPLAG